MEMPVFHQITLLHVVLLVPDVIAATAIIQAAVAVIIEVVVAVIIVHTVPKEAILVADAAEAAPGGGPVHVAHHNHDHLDDTTAGHNLTEDIDLTLAAGADLDHQEEGTAFTPVLQITNAPKCASKSPRRKQH